MPLFVNKVTLSPKALAPRNAIRSSFALSFHPAALNDKSFVADFPLKLAHGCVFLLTNYLFLLVTTLVPLTFMPKLFSGLRLLLPSFISRRPTSNIKLSQFSDFHSKCTTLGTEAPLFIQSYESDLNIWRLKLGFPLLIFFGFRYLFLGNLFANLRIEPKVWLRSAGD